MNDAETSWFERLKAIMAQVPDREPMPGDEMPVASFDLGEVGEDGVVYLGPGSGSGVSHD